MARWAVTEVGKGGRVMAHSLKRGRGSGKNYNKFAHKEKYCNATVRYTLRFVLILFDLLSAWTQLEITILNINVVCNYDVYFDFSARVEINLAC